MHCIWSVDLLVIFLHITVFTIVAIRVTLLLYTSFCYINIRVFFHTGTDQHYLSTDGSGVLRPGGLLFLPPTSFALYNSTIDKVIPFSPSSHSIAYWLVDFEHLG